MSYGTIVTQTGETALNQAAFTGESVELTHLVIGNGNGAPLVVDNLYTLLSVPGEVYRAAITAAYTDPVHSNQMILEALIPVDVGGFIIRAVGAVDTTGRLIFAGNFPETPKPTVAEGATRDIRLQMVVATSHTAYITVVVNPNQVVATQDYADMIVWNHEQKTDPHPQYVTDPELQVHINDETPHPDCIKTAEHNTSPEAHADIRADIVTDDKLYFFGQI